MAQKLEPRPYFLLFLHDNLRKSRNCSISMGLKFIEDFIFLTKKFFLTKFQKLAIERNFDLHLIKAILHLFFILHDKNTIR